MARLALFLKHGLFGLPSESLGVQQALSTLDGGNLNISEPCESFGMQLFGSCFIPWCCSLSNLTGSFSIHVKLSIWSEPQEDIYVDVGLLLLVPCSQFLDLPVALTKKAMYALSPPLQFHKVPPGWELWYPLAHTVCFISPGDH